MAPTPSPKPYQTHHTTPFKTPLSKQRLNFTSRTPHSHMKEALQVEHPIEVIGRIRNSVDKAQPSNPILQVNPDLQTIRVRADMGYRDFMLDGISLSEQEDLDAFYKNFIEKRIDGVRVGAKCTIMMYGPTGSGKSHTMFGCGKQPGIVYRSLKGILGEGEEKDGVGPGTFVQITVLEVYNEEIYDLLSNTGGNGLGIGWPKGASGSKVKLEVMGKKAKNASFIFGKEAAKISKEIQKVEKRRIVKSTQCNERSSRSHCIIILDVPTVGGRLMLVDMAGSENIEQAGQLGFEAKMQTGKINQGNIALKRVVESIANGDSHVPFRDSKLTMLLQDSFEDDKSKILMILCASPDSKELHKTICTLEYGAKAKCIVRGPHTPGKDKMATEDSSAVVLVSRIAAMDEFIYKLQLENKLREKERDEAQKKLSKKEEEVAALRSRIQEEEINVKVNGQTRIVEVELEKKLLEYKKMADEQVEAEKKRMEEKLLKQREECEMLRRRLEEVEFQLRDGKMVEKDIDGSSSGFARRILGACANEEAGMVKSMDLDMDDHDPYVGEVKNDRVSANQPKKEIHEGFVARYGDRACLSTVFEEEEVEEEDEEVEKEVIEVKRVCSSPITEFDTSSPQKLEQKANELPAAVDSRRLRIQNIFTLCGNNRELSHNIGNPVGSDMASPMKEEYSMKNSQKENSPVQKNIGVLDNGWEKNADNNAKCMTTPKVLNGELVEGEDSIKSPLMPLENRLLSPQLASTPFITVRRR